MKRRYDSARGTSITGITHLSLNLTLAEQGASLYDLMMDIPRPDLSDRIAALPPEAQAEVGDFVAFLSDKASKQAAWDRLLAIAPALEVAAQAVTSEAEIAAEVAAARAERRSQSPR